MGSAFDIERLFIGEDITDLSQPYQLKNLSDRLQKIETILKQNLTQWNAPSLVRNEADDWFIQTGAVNLNGDKSGGETWNDPFLVGAAITFTTAFETTPRMFMTITGQSIDTRCDNILISPVSTTGFTPRSQHTSNPSSGVVSLNWIAIGKKVL